MAYKNLNDETSQLLPVHTRLESCKTSELTHQNAQRWE